MLMFTSTHSKIVSQLESEIAEQLERRKLESARGDREHNRAVTSGRALSEALAQRDALQAKIDRMTGGLKQNRRSSANGGQEHHNA